MNRAQFLKDDNVAQFVDWLINNLPNIKVSLDISKSRRFVPNGVRANCQGIEAVLPHYAWMGTWQANKTRLGTLSARLRDAVSRHSEEDALKACREILEWGGVRGAVSFLKALADPDRNGLVAYLTERQPLFQLDGAQNLSDLDATIIDKFDAGMTKIYSLLDTTGSPIYDSRVGAAMAMLYQCHLRSVSPIKRPIRLLNFPSGAARGKQIRNPGALGKGFLNAPKFYTNSVKPHDWAQFQLKLGWIIREILRRTEWFANEGATIAERSRAFEASLFMIGYDLRSLAGNGCCNPASGVSTITPVQSHSGAETEQSSEPEDYGWVPTAHPFTAVLEHFLRFRQSEQPSYGLRDFKRWLIGNYVKRRGDPKIPIKSSTAHDYLFPLRTQEFDLVDRSIAELECIVRGGQEGLECAVRDRTLNVDERAWVCLVDAWIVGQLWGVDPRRCKEILQHAKFVGDGKHAWKTLLDVGKQVGKHFGLLNDDAHQTDLYRDFFTKRMVMEDEQEVLDQSQRTILGD